MLCRSRRGSQTRSVSCAAYMGQLFYPIGLAVFYPHARAALPSWQVAGALLLLAAISLGVLVWRRSCPALLIGWCWYLGMLVPVIGLVQVGGQSMADRYTYLPQIGLVIALTWAAKQILEAWSYRGWTGWAVAGLVVAALMAKASEQASYWRDSETLWSHALSCNPRNPTAHLSLGVAAENQGCLAEAVEHYRKAIELDHEYAQPHNDLAGILLKDGRLDEALAEYKEALRIDPEYANAHTNYGVALLRQDRVAEAIDHFRRALAIDPHLSLAYYNLGTVLTRQGKLGEAVVEFRKALDIQPGYALAHYKLGFVLYHRGDIQEAVAQWSTAIRLQPDNARFLSDLAWVLATCPEASIRDGARAVVLAREAVKLTGGKDPRSLDILAAACAEAGRFSEAVAAARQALALVGGQDKAADGLRARLKLYESGSPYHQSVPLSQAHSGQS